MKIVKIIGGLGNQMFQYAFYTTLKNHYKENIKIDINAFNNYRVHNGFELMNIFDINPDIADISEIKFLVNNYSENIISKILKKIGINKKTHVIERQYNYDKHILELEGDYYLEGYWQSYKYFNESEKEIRDIFTFKNELDDKNKDILNRISSTESISIHVRRGDYISNPKANKLHGNICTTEYYNEAIELICSRVENPCFYIFSDDIEWCKNNLKLNYNYEFIDWNHGTDSYKDMQLMSNCNHNIIANSSFSWWGAWLNNNESKIVIAPKIWFNDKTKNTTDLKPNDWIEI